jgi:hypothetical protein
VLLLLVMRLHAAAAATSGTRELAMVSLLLLIAASFQIKHTLQLKREKREIDIAKRKEVVYSTRDFAKERRNISSPFPSFCFFQEDI